MEVKVSLSSDILICYPASSFMMNRHAKEESLIMLPLDIFIFFVSTSKHSHIVNYGPLSGIKYSLSTVAFCGLVIFIKITWTVLFNLKRLLENIQFFDSEW